MLCVLLFWLFGPAEPSSAFSRVPRIKAIFLKATQSHSLSPLLLMTICHDFAIEYFFYLSNSIRARDIRSSNCTFTSLDSLQPRSSINRAIILHLIYVSSLFIRSTAGVYSQLVCGTACPGTMISSVCRAPRRRVSSGENGGSLAKQIKTENLTKWRLVV